MSITRSSSSNYLRAPESADHSGGGRGGGEEDGGRGHGGVGTGTSSVGGKAAIWQRVSGVLFAVALASLVALIVVALDCDSTPTDAGNGDGSGSGSGSGSCIPCAASLNCCMSLAYLEQAERIKFAMSPRSSQLFDSRIVRSVPIGAFPSMDFRVILQDEAAPDPNAVLSFWDDVPFRPDSPAANLYAMVCEIPRGARAKMEIAAKDEAPHPIRQDIKDGALRYSIYGEYSFNYGAIPQTWENDTKLYYGSGLYGDGDPIDVYDLSSRPCYTGEILRVKILAAIPLIDSGEIDWKVIAISDADPYFGILDSLQDVQEKMPRALEGLVEFLRNYKSCNNGSQNAFYLSDLVDKEKALEVIEDGHLEWLTRGV